MATDRDTALFSAATFKSGYVELSGSVPFADALLAILIPAVSSTISKECGRKFERDTHTVYLDGTGSDTIYLPHWPVVISGSVTRGIWEGGTKLDKRTGGSGGDYVVFGDEDDDADSEGDEASWGQILKASGEWTKGRRNIKAVYLGGYVTIPEDIVLTAMEWTAVEFQKANKEQFTATSETAAPGGSVAISPLQMPLSVRQRLDNWRRHGNW